MSVAVVLVAAGSGTRLGAGVPKAFAPLAGAPLLEHALRGVLECVAVTHVVVVAPGSHLDQARALVADRERVDVVAGGADRTASVRAGLLALAPEDGIVLVHDAARALTPAALFDAVIDAVRAGHPAVVPGLRLSDTIKAVDATGRVVATHERDSLRAIQTPQGFLRPVLERAHAGGWSATDDAGLVERAGDPVFVIDGDSRALKVTTPADVAVAATLLGG